MPQQAPNQYAFDYSSQSVEAYKRITQAVLATVGRNLTAKCFMQLIYRFEKPDRGLQWTYDELAEELFCHRTTAIRLVRSLEEAGLIRAVETRTRDGGDAFNEYRLDWDGIDATNARRIELEYGATMRRTGSHGATPGSHGATAHKEESYKNSNKYSGTGSGGRAETADGFGEEERQAADGEPFQVATPLTDPRMARVARDALRSSLIVDVPLLVEAAERWLVPRPCSQFTGFGHALFANLKTEHPQGAGLLAWHLEQLSAPEVFCGPTEADLLLTLAAGEYAGKFPQAEIRKTRVALFVSVVSRGEWRRVLSHLVRIREKLDRVQEKYWLANSDVQIERRDCAPQA